MPYTKEEGASISHVTKLDSIIKGFSKPSENEKED